MNLILKTPFLNNTHPTLKSLMLVGFSYSNFPSHGTPDWVDIRELSPTQITSDILSWVRFFETLIGTDFVLIERLAGFLLIVNDSVAGGIVSTGGIMLPLEKTSRFSGGGVG